MQLPRQLEPWRIWLTLFPPELVEPMGELLLRLHPLVGRLSSAALNVLDTPVGVGEIVRRGEYQRLLMTEWMIADTEPDEFIRRAANNELLFTGPEPATHLRSQQCIVLFDVGPAQLGEPRLVHMAMFILLARRAEEAGAQFLWGMLQLPGKLSGATGVKGLQGLLGNRALAAPSAADLAAWGEALATNKMAVDGWLLSARGMEAPKKIASRVSISCDMLTPRLRVRLDQRHAHREVMLDLPETGNAVRLLREPFVPQAPRARVRHATGHPSLKQAPLFAVGGLSIAVAQLDGSTVVYQVPQSPRATVGKIRTLKAPASGSVLGSWVYKKNAATLVADGERLIFSNIPGRLFSAGRAKCERPDQKSFRAVAGTSRWLPMFCQHMNTTTQVRERVLMIDLTNALVCWEIDSVKADKAEFRTIASNVNGTMQTDSMLLYAVAGPKESNGAAGQTRLFRLRNGIAAPEPMKQTLMPARRVLFGMVQSWYQPNALGLLALQQSDTDWWVGTGNGGNMIECPHGATVFGVARNWRSAKFVDGLIVLQHDRKSILFIGVTERFEVARSHVDIAQVAFNETTNHIAWLTRDRELLVQQLAGDKPLLHVVPHEVVDGE